MSQIPDALWLNVSPALNKFDRPLLKIVSQHTSIAQWQHQQSMDEATSLDTALVLLHDYLKHHPRPIHLLGHSTGGLLALLYARRYPQRVRSLTLLSVGVHPAVDWQTHYYIRRQLLPCPQVQILQQMVYELFGYSPRTTINALVKLLQQDLYQSLSPNHLFRQVKLFPLPVQVPLLVCGSVDDSIIAPSQLTGWKSYFNPSSQLWICPGGRYFFHYFYAQQVNEQIAEFWHSIGLSSEASHSIEVPDQGLGRSPVASPHRILKGGE